MNFLNIKDLKLLFSPNSNQGQAVEDHRKHKRNRNIALSSFTGVLAKAINILAGLISVPIALPYLGVEQFGIWMTLTGLVALLSFSDLGLAAGLQTHLTKCYGSDDRKTPASLISSTLGVVVIIAILLCVFALMGVPNFDLTYVVKLTDSENHLVLQYTAQIVLIVFAVGLFAGVIQRIFEAYQAARYSNSILVVGRLLSLASVFLCVYYQQPLHIMVLFYMGFPFVGMIIGGLYLFYSRSWLRPVLRGVRLYSIKKILSTGILVLSTQVGAALSTSGFILVLSSQFGAAAIVPFTLCLRLLSGGNIILAVSISPLWPAYGEAKERGDVEWIRSSFVKSAKLAAFIIIPIFCVMSLFGTDIIRAWATQEQAVPSWELLMLCNFMALFLSVNIVCTTLLNGLARFSYQAIYSLMLPIISLSLCYLYAGDLGLVAVVGLTYVATEVVRTFFLGIESSYVFKRLF